MRSIFKTAALATLLSYTNAAPVVGGLLDVVGIVPGLATAPTDPKALAAWSAARGMGFNPDYVHVPLPGEVRNPQYVAVGVSSLAGNLTSLPLSRGSLSSGSLGARINAPDDRYQYTNPNAYPWRAIGKVLWSSGVSCTGQMVGPRHVLTAKHCIPGSDNPNVALTFSPSYDRGPNPTFGSANVVNIVFNGTNPGTAFDCRTKYDHVVLIIDKRFGDGLGFFGAEIPNSNFWNRKIFTTVGYPSDRDSAERPYRQDNSQLPNPGRISQFSCDKYGPIYSDSDVATGQSGSAIWKDAGVVWGVCSNLYNYSDGVSVTGWASGDDLVNMISYARQAFQ